MASTPTRVLLVDDHPVMRDGLQQLLERTGEFQVVGHAGDGEEAERVAKEVVPDLVIMDVLMPGRDGIDACREIIDTLPDVRVLILTASTEKDAVIEAVAAGADGYLQKFTGTEQLLAMVRDVAGGEYRMPRDVMRRVFRRLRHLPEDIDSPRRKGLTEREKEILTQFAKGMSYSAIAESRGNRSSTVRNTIYHIKVLPVPISPTTVVPRWALRERAAPLMASACAPRGLRSSLGSLPPFSEGR